MSFQSTGNYFLKLNFASVKNQLVQKIVKKWNNFLKNPQCSLKNNHKTDKKILHKMAISEFQIIKISLTNLLIMPIL